VCPESKDTSRVGR